MHPQAKSVGETGGKIQMGKFSGEPQKEMNGPRTEARPPPWLLPRCSNESDQRGRRHFQSRRQSKNGDPRQLRATVPTGAPTANCFHLLLCPECLPGCFTILIISFILLSVCLPH